VSCGMNSVLVGDTSACQGAPVVRAGGDG
jgi:hypothetical protein